METTDNEEQEQRAAAKKAIAFAAKRYKSKRRRIQELDYWRDLYQSIGWPVTVDLVEAQMIAWGRVERAENMSLYASYTEEMKQHHVDRYKKEWTAEESQHLAYFKVYERARYAIRFMTIADALIYLQEKLDYWRAYPQKPYARKINQDEQKYWDVYLERLQFVIDQLRELL